MSSLYCKAEEFNYFFKSEPRQLSVYDSLSWSDNFGHTVDGQGGIVLKTLTDEVRLLNREIFKLRSELNEAILNAGKVSDTADIAKKPAASRNAALLDP